MLCWKLLHASPWFTGLPVLPWLTLPLPFHNSYNFLSILLSHPRRFHLPKSQKTKERNLRHINWCLIISACHNKNFPSWYFQLQQKIWQSYHQILCAFSSHCGHWDAAWGHHAFAKNSLGSTHIPTPATELCLTTWQCFAPPQWQSFDIPSCDGVFAWTK